nr:HNH endonuclease signature motif containing protein [Cellulomonas humilata]
MLGSVPVAEVSGAALVNGVAAWQQVLTMVQAAQAVWVRELEARTPDALRHVPDELACVLVSTKRHAETVFLRAWGTGQHPALNDAWTAGAIDTRKVDVILDEIHRSGTALSAHEVDAAVSDAVDRAAELTGPQLTRHLRATLIAADPAVAEQRRLVERQRRGVFLELAPDAMARLIAYLPAADATAAFTAIDALAGHAAIDGDTRSIDQRRADAFSDVFTSILDRQTTPDGTPLPTRHGQRVALQVTVAASTLAGLDDRPAMLGSYGPIPAQVARELAQDATWRRLLTDPTTGQARNVGTHSYRPGADLTRTVQARDVTCTFPGCRQPATRCEIDHRTPYDHTRTTSGDQTCEANLHSLCTHHHQAKTKGWWQVTHNHHTGISTWTDRHGLTYARHPIPIHTTPDALIHRRRSAPRADSGDPPF